MRVIDDILDLVLLIAVVAEMVTVMVLTAQSFNENKDVAYQTEDKTLTIMNGDNSVDITVQDKLSGAEIISIISMLSDSTNLKYHTIILPNYDRIVITENYNDNIADYIARTQAAISVNDFYIITYNSADSLKITKQ